MLTVDDDDEIVLVATDGTVIRTGVKDIRTIGRNTQGVKIMTPQPGAVVSAVARALGEKKEEDATESAPSEVDGAPASNGPSSEHMEPDSDMDDATNAEDDFFEE